MVVIERWPPNRGFLSTILNGDAVGTKPSGRYREGGRLSGTRWPLRGVLLYTILKPLQSDEQKKWKEVAPAVKEIKRTNSQ